MTRNIFLKQLALAFALLTLPGAPLVFGQAPSPAPPARPEAPAPPSGGSQHGGRSGGHEGHEMGIIPAGTWWKNPNTVALLALAPDQQKKMDDLFRQSRIQLVDVKASLEKEQINLEPLLNANPIDSPRALAVISKIADLRADLEKADARMLLSLRAVLTPDQWTKLQADTHGRHFGPSEPERRGQAGPRPGRGGPGSSDGPGHELEQ